MALRLYRGLRRRNDSHAHQREWHWLDATADLADSSSSAEGRDDTATDPAVAAAAAAVYAKWLERMPSQLAGSVSSTDHIGCAEVAVAAVASAPAGHELCTISATDFDTNLMEHWTVPDVECWVDALEIPGPEEEQGRAVIRRAFLEEDMDGEELSVCTAKRLGKMLARAGTGEGLADMLTSVIIETRNNILALQFQTLCDASPLEPAVDAQHGQHVGALEQCLRDEQSRREKAEEAQDMTAELMQSLLIKERESTQLQVEARSAALAAWRDGFPVLVRRVGSLDCSSRKRPGAAVCRALRCVPVEGPMGISNLQSLVLDSSWHPTKVVVVNNIEREEILWNDSWVNAIERTYPGRGVAKFVVTCWQELMRFNPSGGYVVEIPWSHKYNDEMTAAEVVYALIKRPLPRRRSSF